jgi:hypothetical protein
MTVFSLLYVYPRLRLVKEAALDNPISKVVKRGFALMRSVGPAATSHSSAG